jgi:hypothetical protein
MLCTMAELNKQPVTLEELMVSTLATVNAVTKLLIEKGVISEAEFKEKLLKERATYQTLVAQRQAALMTILQALAILEAAASRWQ